MTVFIVPVVEQIIGKIKKRRNFMKIEFERTKPIKIISTQICSIKNLYPQISNTRGYTLWWRRADARRLGKKLKVKGVF